jgi:aminoglycoside 3-N-acetyltransferase
MAGRANRRALAQQLRDLGISAGDVLMVHASLRSVGPVLGGADAIIWALRDAVVPQGTLLAYADWETGYDDLLTPDRRVPERWRDDVMPFDPLASRATRDNGAFAELLRTTPGARRSANPGASCVALGARADWLVSGHGLNYGYGPSSPFAKLVEASGKVLMLGAPLDTMTLLHHAEHLADIPGKRVIAYDVPIAENGGTIWHRVEEFDTSDPVVDGLADDYFEEIVESFLDTGNGKRGLIGAAPSVLVSAPAVTAFAVDWLERR